MRNTRPRTFEEVVAAQDPTKMASLTRGDRFVDPSVNAFHGRCRSARGSGASSISTMTGAATLRSSQVLRPRGGRATISSHSSLVAFVSNENPFRSSRSQMSDIPRGTIFGRRVGDPPKSVAEHFVRCSACGGWIDCRDLGQVFEHEGPLPHPLQDQPQ
jgi:hypothetical protein